MYLLFCGIMDKEDITTGNKVKLISMDKPLGDFKSFIDRNNNKRIFFSGKFGSGKTFFLKIFFEKYAKDYDVYYLSPIRYQIRENRDIIQLIKYDIVVRIFEKDPELKSKRANGVGEIIRKFGKHLDLHNLMQNIPRLGRPLTLGKNVYDALAKAAKNGDSQQLSEFKDNMEKQLVNSLDFNLRSKIKALKKERKSILVLDDLDRMDPKHIFRILNILSAEMEAENENEMSFDHIILVGDRGNIKHIFHHKYGATTDFQGYFDKFCSAWTYEFDNISSIANWISQEFIKLTQSHEGLSHCMGDSGLMKIFIGGLLKQLIGAKAINLRQLCKPIYYQMPGLSKNIEQDFYNDTHNSPFSYFDRSLEVLISLFEEDKKDFIQALQKIRARMPDSFKQLSEDASYDESFYFNAWKIIHKDENTSKDFNETPPKIFYDTLIQYTEDKLWQ